MFQLPQPDTVKLRTVLPSDLDVFFQHQLDPEAIRMAAFTPKDPTDRAYFDAHWQKIIADQTLTLRTILFEGQVAGYIVCHSWFGMPEVGYWLGRDFWGRDVTTRALRAFLEILPTRPLYAHVASDNLASRRVLEKCGFRVIGSGKAFANGRGEEIEELILELGEYG